VRPASFRPAAARAFAVLLIAGVLAPAPARAETVTCAPGERLDVVSYDWRLKGFLSFIAGLKFPTRGTGALATLYHTDGTVDTELRIIANERNGDRYHYRSVIDLDENRTLESVDGYHFDGRTKSDTTTFDYEKGKARRVRLDTKKGDGETVRFEDFSGTNVKDVLTSIYHIRQTAGEMDEPQRHGVFAGGKIYEVLITPGGTKMFQFDGRTLNARVFTITATPENRNKWPGDVNVWITTDEDRLPVQIDLGKSMASLRLDAVTRFSCP
jgi:hypothetical protein